MRRLFFHEESIHEVSRRYLEHEYIHTYVHTYIHTDKPKPICPPPSPHFFKVGGIITGDFNLNVTNPNTLRKIESICSQFSLYQLIEEPTHFTEQSSSIIDLFFVTNKDNVVLSGVNDPFLQQNIRYHCPTYVILKFSKPKSTSFERHIWYYDKGDFNKLRNKASQTDWFSLQDNDIDIYANNISNRVIGLAAECIPNKTVRIKPFEPPWISCHVKRYIRKRKRAYRKAKRTNLQQDWQKFKTLRNKTTQMMRDAK